MKQRYNIILLILMLEFLACLKKEPKLPVVSDNNQSIYDSNTTLSYLSTLIKNDMPILIDSNFIIKGIIIANDATGNFKDQIIIDDGTTGAAIKINLENLYLKFPIGAQVIIKLKGIYLSKLFNNLEIGGAGILNNANEWQVSLLPPKAINEYFIVDKNKHEIIPIEVNISELSQPQYQYTNRLLKVDNIEFQNPLSQNTLALSTSALNLLLTDCSGNLIPLRTSQYATFQNYPTPKLNGSIVGIYALYKETGQLMIRDINDLSFTKKRCDGKTFLEDSLISIQYLRSIYKGSDTVLPNFKIRGIVSSHRNYKNFSTTTITLQDATAGMMVYFSGSSINLPDFENEIELSIAGSTLTKYNGALEIKNVNETHSKIIQDKKSIIAKSITVKNLKDSFIHYESMLVKIPKTTFISKGIFSGNKIISDGTSNIVLYTSSAATFANDPIPTTTKTIQGVVTPYNSVQELKIRHPSMDIF
jgi:hypothetical protein